MYFTSLKLDLILASAAAPAKREPLIPSFIFERIWYGFTALEGAEVQELRWDTDYEHESCSSPVRCTSTQLLSNITAIPWAFSKLQKETWGFFPWFWFWSLNWTVNILVLILPLTTFDSSLCVFQGWMSVWSTMVAALICVWTNQSALAASAPLAISSWTERLVAVNKDADRLEK